MLTIISVHVLLHDCVPVIHRAAHALLLQKQEEVFYKQYPSFRLSRCTEWYTPHMELFS